MTSIRWWFPQIVDKDSGNPFWVYIFLETIICHFVFSLHLNIFANFPWGGGGGVVKNKNNINLYFLLVLCYLPKNFIIKKKIPGVGRKKISFYVFSRFMLYFQHFYNKKNIGGRGINKSHFMFSSRFMLF